MNRHAFKEWTIKNSMEKAGNVQDVCRERRPKLALGKHFPNTFIVFSVLIAFLTDCHYEFVLLPDRDVITIFDFFSTPSTS
jgi:hypothetical protein